MAGMSLTQYESMFNTLKSQAGITNDQILMALFMQGLHVWLKDAAESSIPVPAKLAEWCEQVCQFDQVFHRSQYQMDAFGHINPMSTSISAALVKPQVEVNHLSALEKAQRYKEKLCFKCGKLGHFTAVCWSTPFNPPGPWGPQQNYRNPQGGGGPSRQW